MTDEQVEDMIEEIASAIRAYHTVQGIAAVSLILIREDGGRRATTYPEKRDERSD